MSYQQPPVNPYGQQPQPAQSQGGQPQNAQASHSGQSAYGAPEYQPQPAVAPKRPMSKGTLRELTFAAILIGGFAFLTGLLSTIAQSIVGVPFGSAFLHILTNLFVAVIFVLLAGLAALYVVPFDKARDTRDLIKRVIIAGALGTAGIFIINIAGAALEGSSYFVYSFVQLAIVGTLVTGITYTALLMLAVFLARALPLRQRPSAEQGGYVPPSQGYQPQQTRQTFEPQQAPQQPGQVIPPQPAVPPQGQQGYSDQNSTGQSYPGQTPPPLPPRP